VQRIVHVSITHPGIDSPFSYLRGKSLVERTLAEIDVPYAVVRPAILFGGDGVVLNNIAWLLRRLPVFAVGGRGRYRIRPVHIHDLAGLCVEKGAERHDNVTDAVGPERPTFVEMVTAIRDAVGSSARIVHVPGPTVPVFSALLGMALGDVILTGEEYPPMAAGLADTDGPPTAPTALSGWIAQHASELGLHYANELHRHYRAIPRTQSVRAAPDRSAPAGGVEGRT
jgi:NADH dehydrogenase